MCNYSSDFIIKYRDSNISKDEKDKFELHILNCEVCRSLVALDKEFIDFLQNNNSAIKKLNKIQVMSNIDLNKYNSRRKKFIIKLLKWKSTSTKIAAILLIVCATSLSLALISPLREGFKSIALNVLDKQSRLNVPSSSSNKSGSDSTQVSTPPPPLDTPIVSTLGTLKNGEYLDQTKVKMSIHISGEKFYLYNITSSNSNTMGVKGTYVIDDNIVTMTTDDKKYTYVFIKDGDNLIFQKNASSIDNRYEVRIDANAKFHLISD